MGGCSKCQRFLLVVLGRLIGHGDRYGFCSGSFAPAAFRAVPGLREAYQPLAADLAPGCGPVEVLAALHKLMSDLAAARRELAKAEAERDKWRAKWEKLEVSRAVCCTELEAERDRLVAATKHQRKSLTTPSHICSSVAEKKKPSPEAYRGKQRREKTSE